MLPRPACSIRPATDVVPIASAGRPDSLARSGGQSEAPVPSVEEYCSRVKLTAAQIEEIRRASFHLPTIEALMAEKRELMMGCSRQLFAVREKELMNLIEVYAVLTNRVPRPAIEPSLPSQTAVAIVAMPSATKPKPKKPAVAKVPTPAPKPTPSQATQKTPSLFQPPAPSMSLSSAAKLMIEWVF